MKNPRYDLWAFGSRRAKPVSKETGIAFEDYKRMGVQVRRQSGERKLPTPEWALNDRKLRKVLVTAMEERAGIKRPQGNLKSRLALAEEVIRSQRPRLIATLTRLCKTYVEIKGTRTYLPEESDQRVILLAQEMFGAVCLPLADDDSGNGAATARALLRHLKQEDYEVEIEGIDTFLRYTEQDGGAGVLAASVYLYYRAGMDSVGVGEELGLKPPHVRQILWRLNETFKNKFADKETVPGVPETAAPPSDPYAPLLLPFDS